jgi:ferredoxin
MLCASACPAGALAAEGFEFGALVGDLHGVADPVVACSRSALRAHGRVPCLGVFAEEHLLALLVFLKGTVSLDASPCAACESGPWVTAALNARMDAVACASGMDAGARIRLVADPGALGYRDRIADRRGFLASLRRLPVAETLAAMRAVREPASPAPALSYASKALPERRETLNRVLGAILKEPSLAPLALSLRRAYYFDVAVGPSCTLCCACMGACPTGAIEIDPGRPEQGVTFNTDRCTGCGLCVSFCLARCIEISRPPRP